MIVLYILLCVALIITLILSIRGSIHIVYKEELKIYFRVLFFKFKLFPEGKIKIDPKKYEKMLKKKEELPSTILTELKQETQKNGLLENIKAITRLISSFVKICAPYMRVKLAKVHIKVASTDAAKTAILYGAVSASVACLIDQIDEFTNLARLTKRSICIEPDFLADKTSAAIDISLSISVFGAIATVLKLMIKHNLTVNKQV
jgi:hypothetical protein